MFILALFTFLALAGVPVWAKVVVNFAACSKYFYKDTEPQRMDQNTEKICQQYGYGSSDYATLYSTFHRIPVYSAYTFDSECTMQAGAKSGNWFIEPQLSSPRGADRMRPESEYGDIIRSRQAVNGDYSNTGYDRGHLNTNSFQCEDGRKATFTLTNSAPMDACFNRVHWKKWEGTVRGILKDQLGEGTAFLVTGTVPSDFKIPRQEEFDDSNSRNFNRVTVPSHVWTAVCVYNENKYEESFSFGYIGLNQPDSKIKVMTIPELNNLLSELYHSPNVNIFRDDCFSGNRKSQETGKYLYKRVQVPLSDKLVISDHLVNMLNTAMDYSDSKQGLTGVTIVGKFNSMSDWYRTSERIKYASGWACVLSQPYTVTDHGLYHTELKKRDTSKVSDEVVCSFVPEQKSTCTSSCLYKEEARGYYCYSGTTERLCSPDYSIITVDGTKCNSGHSCGTHGEDYYWCYVGSEKKYCSPPLPLGRVSEETSCRSDHNCGTYGEKYTWCYTDYKKNWNFCCITPDRFSARNGKTCKPDHPCDSKGWCYTTDGSWERCCTTS